MEHILNQINSLRKDLTPEQKTKLDKISFLVQSEYNKLTSYIERISKGKIGEIEVMDAGSRQTRITVVPKLRTTLKISLSIESQQVREDMIKFARHIRDNYSGPFTGRGIIKWVDGEYRCTLQGGTESYKFVQKP